MKTCFKCRKDKEYSEFYKHAQMGDGYLGKCKSCTKADVAQHREENSEKIKEYDRERFHDPKRKAKVKEYQKTMRTKNPEKYKARTMVSNAVRDGVLTRPENCSECGSAGRIEGHHSDYFKPLDVVWLCFACHRSLAHGQKV